MNVPDKSVFDMFIELMTIIFGANFPPVIAYIVFVFFFLLIFGGIFCIIKLLFSWCL